LSFLALPEGRHPHLRSFWISYDVSFLPFPDGIAFLAAPDGWAFLPGALALAPDDMVLFALEGGILDLYSPDRMAFRLLPFDIAF
jgi:hypothetical protein